MQQYRVPSFASTEELLQRIASLRGKLLPGGVADPQVGAESSWRSGQSQALRFEFAVFHSPARAQKAQHALSGLVSSAVL